MSFLVKGRVSSEKGKPISGLIVEAYDDDVFIDAPIGSATTDDEGSFQIQFEADAFRSFPDIEGQPDIYLNIKTPEGQVLYTTEVRHEAGMVEEFDIKLKDMMKPRT